MPSECLMFYYRYKTNSKRLLKHGVWQLVHIYILVVFVGECLSINGNIWQVVRMFCIAIEATVLLFGACFNYKMFSCRHDWSEFKHVFNSSHAFSIIKLKQFPLHFHHTWRIYSSSYKQTTWQVWYKQTN